MKGSLETRHGIVTSEWQRENGGRLSWNFTIPANVTAEIRLPATDPEQVSGLYAGWIRLDTDDHQLVYEVGSGSYSLTVSPEIE